MAMAYARSRVLCAAARLGVADALGDEVHSLDHVAEICQADVDALYRLQRVLASIGLTALNRALEHAELMPQDQDLQLERRPAPKRGAEGGEQGR